MTDTAQTGASAQALTAGQVLGGRWRPLQYFFLQSVYADIMATCGKGGLCYLKNDGSLPAVFHVVVVEEPLHAIVGHGAHFETDVQMPAGELFLTSFDARFRGTKVHSMVRKCWTPITQCLLTM